MGREVYSQKVRMTVKKLEADIHKHEQAVQDLQDRIERVKCAESPIQPDDIIQWEAGGITSRQYRGKVVCLGSCWSGYEYKAIILSKAGKPLGVAKVRSDQFPSLVEDEK